ncbi:MAG: hypothetical protein IKY38_03605 [Anaerotignum sp.]|nr:hypothetical protein [Anaerotignum sp.]
MAALICAAKAVISPLPNIEPVTLLVMLCALTFGRQAFYAIYVFVGLEFLLYGFGMWFFNYLYVWTVLALVCLPFRSNRSPVFWSIVSGFFGLGFGTLCTLPYLITGGPAAAFSYWVSGLGFDITHCIGNVILCLVLFKPLYALLEKSMKRA